MSLTHCTASGSQQLAAQCNGVFPSMSGMPMLESWVVKKILQQNQLQLSFMPNLLVQVEIKKDLFYKGINSKQTVNKVVLYF